MPTSKSSRRWLREHFSDPYVKQAQKTGYRSRAAYKLLELQEREKLFKPGMVVVDLGAAPGSWSQVVSQLVGKTGRVIALDILPMKALPDVEFIQGDFTEQTVLSELLKRCDTSVDWVISDMAPNLSGMESVDQPRSIALAELAFELAQQVLNKTHGGLLVKVFQGEGFDAFLLSLRHYFEKVIIRKPKASRDRSREVYLLARIG